MIYENSFLITQINFDKIVNRKVQIILKMNKNSFEDDWILHSISFFLVQFFQLPISFNISDQRQCLKDFCWRLFINSSVISMDQRKPFSHNQQRQSLYHENNYDIINAQQQVQACSKQNFELQRIYSQSEAVRRQFEGFAKCVGLLRTNWYSDSHKLKAMSFGTAFALGRRLIMTCGHNLYSQTHKTLASEIIFYPNINFDNTNRSSLKCTKPTYIKLSYPKPSYSYLPTKEELTIFHLDEENELQTDGFLRIGSLDSQGKAHGQKVSMIGYPSTEYYNLQQMNGSFYQKIKKTVLQGQVVSIKNSIINHTMQTSIGFSGSPIICTNSQGELQIIGIHTHKGLQSKYNSGLYFDKEILEIFDRFAKQLKFSEPYLMMNSAHDEQCAKQIEIEPQKYSSSIQKENQYMMIRNLNDQKIQNQLTLPKQSSFILVKHQQSSDADSIILDESIVQFLDSSSLGFSDISQLDQSAFQLINDQYGVYMQSFCSDDTKLEIRPQQYILTGQQKRIGKQTKQLGYNLSQIQESNIDIDQISNQDILIFENKSTQPSFDKLFQIIKVNI